jgi:hypothetical protein
LLCFGRAQLGADCLCEEYSLDKFRCNLQLERTFRRDLEDDPTFLKLLFPFMRKQWGVRQRKYDVINHSCFPVSSLSIGEKG